MRNSMRFMVAACILAVLPVAAGAATKHSWIKPGAIRGSGSGALVFASDYVNNVVNIYSASDGSLVGQVAGYFNFPQSLAVDGANNLYVYNGRTNSIFKFVPPYTGAPVKNYFDGLSGIVGFTVDAAGSIYSANYQQVIEYAHGNTQATYINLPVSQPAGVTVDAKGRLLSTFSNYAAAGVLRMEHNSPIPENLGIALIQAPGDLLYDTAGNLVIESVGGAYISIYAPGKVKPLATWSSGFVSPQHMAMSADGATLYVSDYGNNTVKAFAYPSGQQLWQIGGLGQVYGVAVSPALVPGGKHNLLPPFPSVAKASLGRPVPPIRPDAHHVLSLVPAHSVEPRPAWAKFIDPHARRNASQDELWVAPIHYGAPVQRYTLPNANNGAPNCATPYAYGTNSIGVDFSYNLWVPAANNGPRTGTVQQMTCDTTVGSPIIDNIGQPSDVAFDGKGNTIVGDIITYLPNNGGWYLDTGTASAYDPTGNYIGTLTDPTFVSPHPPGFDNFNILEGVANDAAGNCYISHVANTGGGEVVKFPGCKPAKHGTVLNGPHPWFAGKPAFDAAGNMLITDFALIGYYRIWNLYVFAPPYNKKPIHTIPMWGPAVSCAVGSAQQDVYCANTINGEVDAYTYPGGTYEYSFTNGLSTWGDEGLAIVPGGTH